MNITPSLSESLNARPDDYRYLLLDPLKTVPDWDPFHIERLSENHSKDALRRVPRPDLAWSPEHCPVLIQLAAPGEEINEVWVQHSEARARHEALSEKRLICGWMSSARDPDAMATWLSELCSTLHPGAVIPVFEPLRLELLQATAEAERLAGQLRAASEWHFLSCSGERVTLKGQHSDIPWTMNWGTEQAQTEVREIWRLLSAWSASCALPANAARQAAEAWSASGKAGLHHSGDRLYLALNTLTHPTALMQHAAVQRRLQQASGDATLYFEQLMQTLPDTVWQELHHADATEKGM